MKKKNTAHSTLIIAATLTLGLSGCSSTLDRLEQVGDEPQHTQIENPQAQPGYKPMTWPLPKAAEPQDRHANSLWEPGARAFFRDQRATRVGDILRVKVSINDSAELENESERTRNTREGLAAPNVFGLEKYLVSNPLAAANPENLLEIGGNSSANGSGTVEREEKIDTQVAAMVTQVLPNGNLVIQGRQEVRVNFEMRELTVAGVIRKEDIDMDNTIDSSQIAEARISYGGRGQISDVQQPRWGTQVIDVLSPF